MKCIDPLVTGYERGTFEERSAQTESLPRQSRKNSEDDSRANNNIRETLGILSLLLPCRVSLCSVHWASSWSQSSTSVISGVVQSERVGCFGWWYALFLGCGQFGSQWRCGLSRGLRTQCCFGPTPPSVGIVKVKLL